MEFSITVVNLAGAVALLLWGTHMVQTGVQRAFGSQLRSMLNNALRSRASSFGTGLAVTALLQSSTATGLMVTGLAAEGMIDLVPALAMMLGANVGTTVIVQMLSFNIVAASPFLVLIGVLLFRRDSTSRAHDLGRVFIGLGLMLLALHQLLTIMSPFENDPGLRMFLGAVATVPVLDVLLSATVTWAVHSSVAVVLFVMSLAAKGVIPTEAAFAFVIGANLGTAINPIWEGTSRIGSASRRVPIGNFLIRLIGALIFLAAIGPVARLLTELEPNASRAVANFHTFFNAILAIAMVGFLAPYARFLEWLLPYQTPQANDPSVPLYLDSAAKEMPVVALGAATREALRLIDTLNEMLSGARTAITEGNRKLIGKTKRHDDVLDQLNTAINTYLASIDVDDLSESDRIRLDQILTFAMNLEQAGDVIERNLLPHIVKRFKRGLVLENQSKLLSMMERLSANLRMASSLFMTANPQAARLLADEKVSFRDEEYAATATHIERLRSGSVAGARASALHLDLVRDMKLINSHIVAAAAYPVLEQTGHLLPTRIVAG